MNLTLLKQPYEVSFTGNPMQFIWQISPYSTREQSIDVNVTVRVLVEDVFNSGIFDEVYLQKIYPTDDGKVQLDVSTIVGAYLEYFTPTTDLARPLECAAQRKRYQVTTVLSTTDLPVTDEPVYYCAIKGGLAYEAWHYNEFFTKIISENKKPLLFSAAKELVDPDAIRFFYWIYPLDDQAEQTISYKVYFSDGTDADYINSTKIISGKWSVNCAPCGFSQSGLDAITPALKSAVKFSVKITTPGNTIVEEYFFNLDNRNFYDKYFLLYRNSIGGLETVRLLGEVDLAADYARQQARRTIKPDWFGAVKAQIKDEATEETFSYTADTGFLSKEQLMKIRDLFLSKEVYQVGTEGQTGLVPVALTSSKTKFFSNKDFLVSTSIEWQLAFVNTFFTPGTLMPQTRSCPAVEMFVPSQLNKSTLQFLWSLQDPYNLVEVQIIIGADTYVYTYQGNAGMVTQAFANPVVDDPVNITVKARTICNPNSIPLDYGPFTNVTLQVIGNSLPVAVDDYFQVPIGFAGVLPFSLLDNDYDPDGDPFEALVEWGLFGNTSPAVYSIDAAGNVTISNTPVSLSGPQTFNYHIHEIGSDQYVTGKVTVNFGNGPQAIYIKIVKRNVVNTGNPMNTRSTGEVWIDFFSDPACTVPIDLTVYGLPVSVHFKKVYKDTNGNPPVTTETDTIYYSNGIKMKIYTGEINLYQNGGIVYNYTYYTWTVNAGTGYIPVN